MYSSHSADKKSDQLVSLNYFRTLSLSTIEWKYSKSYTPELEMVKYVYIIITIINDILWKGREGDFALSSMLN